MPFMPGNLRLCRERRGLTTTTLGAMCGRSARTIAAYEAGEVLPPLDILETIAAALGVDVGDLIERQVVS